MEKKDDIIVELQKLHELLLLEKAADLEYHRQRIQKLPLAERVTEGYSWYPVEALKSGYTHGNRAFVLVQRANTEIADQFRAGKTVNLFTRQAGVKSPERSGIIQYVRPEKMKIVLNQSDLPDWLGLGLLGVDLLFDERTYIEMEKALKQIIKAKGDRHAELRDILLGAQEARFRELSTELKRPTLNDSQNQALREAIAAYDLSIIHGPPGTGKTTTLVEIVRELCEREPSVLVTAPSNTAVDLLTERLAAAELRVLRIGNISRVDESIIRHTLEMQLANHPESKTIKKVKIEAAGLRRKAARFRRRMGREEHQERRNLYREAGELSAWANQLETRLIEQLIASAQVITCTLVGANHSTLEGRLFRTVVIDEAAQGLEPATWIPILKARRVILTGDPFQLPPTIKSRGARQGGLEQTLIEKALARQPKSSLLRTQYRMHEDIMGFSNQRFYEGQLLAAESVAQRRLPGDTDPSLVFIDTAGTGFNEAIHEANLSRWNSGEFQVLREHLYGLLEQWQALELVPLPSIALISPYREQVLYMKRAVEEDERLRSLPLTINTIDGFQGQERDVVYISLVRSNDKMDVGFLKDYRRMNVAMTRARMKLVIVGDSATIGNDSFYADFLEYCEENGRYATAWEFMA